jgi:hypothetical protein
MQDYSNPLVDSTLELHHPAFVLVLTISTTSSLSTYTYILQHALLYYSNMNIDCSKKWLAICLNGSAGCSEIKARFADNWQEVAI